MDINEFRIRGKEVIDIICDYYENVDSYPPMSKVNPGYLYDIMPHEAPENPESFESVNKDIFEKILPGMTHWQSGNFFGWFPASTSFPSMIGDMYSNMFNAIGFNWICSPAVTELETIVMDWLGKLIGLNQRFLAYGVNGEKGSGGGVIHNNASEAMIVSMLAARDRMFTRMADDRNDRNMDYVRSLSPRLVAYFSDQTHSSGQKGAGIIGCQARIIQSDSNYRLTEEALFAAITVDRDNGNIPFFVCGTFGTTNTTAIDDFVGIARVAKSENLWFHIDAAYAGCALVCPEFRSLAAGMEFSDSFNFNPHKWMLINFDCSATWVADSTHLTNALDIDREYLPRVKGKVSYVTDYRNWQLSLGRRFRSLKLWFVMRMYGASGIRAYIRQHVCQAKWLEKKLLEDGRFEIMTPVIFALVVFRIKPSAISRLSGNDDTDLALVNKTNINLIKAIQDDNRAFLVGTKIKGMDVLRASIGSTIGKQENVDLLLEVLCSLTTKVTTIVETANF